MNGTRYKQECWEGLFILIGGNMSLRFIERIPSYKLFNHSVAKQNKVHVPRIIELPFCLLTFYASLQSPEYFPWIPSTVLQ